MDEVIPKHLLVETQRSATAGNDEKRAATRGGNMGQPREAGGSWVA